MYYVAMYVSRFCLQMLSNAVAVRSISRLYILLFLVKIIARIIMTK